MIFELHLFLPQYSEVRVKSSENDSIILNPNPDIWQDMIPMVLRQRFNMDIQPHINDSVYARIQNNRIYWIRGICNLYNVSHLGDNCIQIFHLGRYIVGYTVGNFVLRRRAVSVTSDV